MEAADRLVTFLTDLNPSPQILPPPLPHDGLKD